MPIYNYNSSDEHWFTIPSTTQNYSITCSGFQTNIKSALTYALAILASKSKNITKEQLEWAQKVVDTHTDIEYHKNKLEKLNKEFGDLEKSQK